MSCRTSRTFPSPPTIQVAGRQNDMDITAEPVDPNDMTVEDDEEAAAPPANAQQRRGRRKKKIVPRLPPLSERDVGHVIFVGNSKLEA